MAASRSSYISIYTNTRARSWVLGFSILSLLFSVSKSGKNEEKGACVQVSVKLQKNICRFARHREREEEKEEEEEEEIDKRVTQKERHEE